MFERPCPPKAWSWPTAPLARRIARPLARRADDQAARLHGRRRARATAGRQPRPACRPALRVPTPRGPACARRDVRPRLCLGKAPFCDTQPFSSRHRCPRPRRQVPGAPAAAMPDGGGGASATRLRAGVAQPPTRQTISYPSQCGCCRHAPRRRGDSINWVVRRRNCNLTRVSRHIAPGPAWLAGTPGRAFTALRHHTGRLPRWPAQDRSPPCADPGDA